MSADEINQKSKDRENDRNDKDSTGNVKHRYRMVSPIDNLANNREAEPTCCEGREP